MVMLIFWILLAILFLLIITYFFIFPLRNKEKIGESHSLIIDFSGYNKYLVMPVEFKLDFYLELDRFREDYELAQSDIVIESLISKEGFEMIRFSKNTTFYAYHNFVSRTGALGFAKNQLNEKEDYLFFIDPEMIEEGDTQVGSFRNGKCFSAFLPDLLTDLMVELTTKFHVSFEEIYNNYSLKNIS